MCCRKAEDAGGLPPVKDDNAAAARLHRRAWLPFKLFDYTGVVFSQNRELCEKAGAASAFLMWLCFRCGDTLLASHRNGP